MQDITGRNNIYRLSKTPSAEKYSTELWEAVAINDYVGAYFYVYSSVDISGAVIQIVHSDDGEDWYPVQDYEVVKRGFANAGHGYAVGYLGTKPYIRLRTSSDVSMDAYLVWLPTSWPSSVSILQEESVPGAGSPPPPLGECPECPTCPTCPECGKCPPCNCPDCPPAAPCPDCPICPPLQSCPICPECPPQEECPICPSCPECPPQIECPTCPELPDTSDVLTVVQVSMGEAGQTLKRVDYYGNEIDTVPDFDTHPIYSNIKEEKIGENYFVSVPKIYFKRSDYGKYVDGWSVSARPLPGYEVHPAFKAQDAVTELDRVLIGKYQSGKIYYRPPIGSAFIGFGSAPGKPLIKLTQAQALSSVYLTNSLYTKGYHLFNIHELALIQILMLIEYATTNIGSVIGDSSGTDLAPDDPAVTAISWRGITGLWRNDLQGIYGIYNNGDAQELKGGMKLMLAMYEDNFTNVIWKANYTGLSLLSFGSWGKCLSYSDVNWTLKHTFLPDPMALGADLQAFKMARVRYNFQAKALEYFVIDTSSNGLFSLSTISQSSAVIWRLSKW